MEARKEKILKELKISLLSRLHDDLRGVVLFGSQLTANASEDSDYDILILLRNKADAPLEREISDICYEIDLRFGIVTDTHILSDLEMDSLRGKQPIFVNAINQGYYI